MKRILAYVAGGIALLGIWALSGEIGRFIGRSAIEGYNQGKQEGAVERAVKHAVHELRNQLPMQVDEATTLLRVASAGKALIYHYRLSSAKRDMDLTHFHAIMASDLISNVCQHEDMRYMMEMGANYRYVYMSADGLLIDEITIRASDC